MPAYQHLHASTHLVAMDQVTASLALSSLGLVATLCWIMVVSDWMLACQQRRKGEAMSARAGYKVLKMIGGNGNEACASHAIIPSIDNTLHNHSHTWQLLAVCWMELCAFLMALRLVSRKASMFFAASLFSVSEIS